MTDTLALPLSARLRTAADQLAARVLVGPPLTNHDADALHELLVEAADAMGKDVPE